jgi:hypothetical protein
VRKFQFLEEMFTLRSCDSLISINSGQSLFPALSNPSPVSTSSPSIQASSVFTPHSANKQKSAQVGTIDSIFQSMGMPQPPTQRCAAARELMMAHLIRIACARIDAGDTSLLPRLIETMQQLDLMVSGSDSDCPVFFCFFFLLQI